MPCRVIIVTLLAALLTGVSRPAEAADHPPNIVFILCDNLGYGDIGCFGSKLHRTPHVDRLAEEGLRLTSHYSASGVCTPSRAALMTGSYPRRVGLHFTDPDGAVLRPVSPNGLHPDEVTIAELLRQAGYATTCIGKWHLGDQLPLLPTRQGFDSWLGIPYSDDMTPRDGQIWPPLPLMRNDTVIEAPVDRNLLTRRYTDAAVQFIAENKDRPFLLYLPHAMPGSTTHPFASEAFQGRSANGAWGDSVEEIDWSTGQILDALKQHDLEQRTLVIWTSDNGAPRRNPPQGSNAPLGGWGYSVNEGGMRVPCVVRWPGVIPAGTSSDALTTLMDWFPTFAALAGLAPDSVRTIDGHNIVDVLIHPADAESPYDVFLYYHRDELHAARSEQWKLFLKGRQQGMLYDVAADPGETRDLAAVHPEIVTQITALAHGAAEEIGDGETPGSAQRPVGRVEQPTPRTLDADN